MVTQASLQDTIPLEEIDELLASHTFGNSDYITEQMHLSIKRRLHKISAHLPVAGQLLDALNKAEPFRQYRLIGDTIVRCAVQHAYRQVETGAPYGLPLRQCVEVFEASLGLLAEGESAPLGSKLVHRLGSDPHYGWIWSEDRSDDVFGRSFLKVVTDNYGDEPRCTLTADELTAVSKGVQLFHELLPHLSRSTLAHTHLTVFFAADRAATPSSSSEFRLSGTIFLSRRLLASPWWVAEHLFHESLHQLLYDFRAGHSLLAPNAAREGAPRICSLWNVPETNRGNYWDVHRALAAFHVYVHLALLASVAEHRSEETKSRHEAEYGPNRMVGSRTACARAHYLGEQLRLPLYWEEVGHAGKRMVDWLSAVLDVLDPSPPSAGAYVHLLLDRYWREAREVEIGLINGTISKDMSDQLRVLSSDEVRSVRNVLAAADVEFAVSEFDHKSASLPNDQSGMEFVRTRDLIIETLMEASPSPDCYQLSDSGVLDAQFKQVVEASSERLKYLFDR